MKRYTFSYGLAVALVALAAVPARAQFGVPITPPAPLNNSAASDTGTDSTTRVVTDGLGNWVAIWDSFEPMANGDIGLDSDLLVSRSIDNGAMWTDPKPLNTNADDDTGNDLEPALATDGAGHWVVVWASREAEILGGIGIDSDILFARSSDNGDTWSEPIPLNINAADDTGSDSSPQITTDGQGNWVVVWSSAEPSIASGLGTDYDILVSRSNSNGAMWTAPVPLNTNAESDTGFDQLPNVATDGLGNWVVVWESEEPNIGAGLGTDYDILAARSTDNGQSWTSPLPLNTNADDDTGDDFIPQLATDGLGNWVAIWDSTEANIASGIGGDDDILVARSMDDGGTWTDPAPLNTNAGDDVGEDKLPWITTDGQGNWVAAWHSIEREIAGGIGPDNDILVARSADNGVSWTAPAPLNTNAATDSGEDFGPDIVTDRWGNWLVAWYSSEANVDAGIGLDLDVLMARFALPDCNGNGIPDGQDITNGTSMDGNANGVPDECETVLVGQPNCGAGMCGAGSAMPLLVTCLVVPLFRRRLGFRGSRRSDKAFAHDSAGDHHAQHSSERPTPNSKRRHEPIKKRRAFSVVVFGALLGSTVKPASAQFGVSITAPFPLNNNAVLDTKSDEIRTLATDGKCNCVAIWQSEESAILGGIGADSDILVVRSMDNGAIWTEPIP